MDQSNTAAVSSASAVASFVSPAPEDDPLLNERQAAALLGVAVGTLQVWRSTKRYPLQYIKIGANVRYRRSAILRFLESRTVSA